MPKKKVEQPSRLAALDDSFAQLTDERLALEKRVSLCEATITEYLSDEVEEDLAAIRDRFAAAYISGVAGHPMRAPNAVEWVNFAYEIAEAAIARRRLHPGIMPADIFDLARSLLPLAESRVEDLIKNCSVNPDGPLDPNTKLSIVEARSVVTKAKKMLGLPL